MSYSLVLLNGPQAGAGIPLNREGPPVTIGRDPSRELPIDDPACSRLHARLWHDGQQWWIEDCGSRNGTFVNSRRIERMTLQPGDAVRIGERLLVFVDERRPNRLQRWTPSDLKTTTFVARVPEAAQQRVIQEELCAVADSAAVRRAAVLCRLAGQLHDKDSVTALVELVSEALQSGTDAEEVLVWLAGPDGRLRLAGRLDHEAGQRALPSVSEPQPTVAPEPSRKSRSEAFSKAEEAVLQNASALALLVMQRGEALLVHQQGVPRQAETFDRLPDQPPEEALDTTGPLETTGDNDGSRPVSAICVPIRTHSGRSGVIELHRSEGSDVFSPEDLNLAIAVAHQLGMALENLQHRQQLEQANRQLRERVASESRIIGTSPQIRRLHDLIARIAPTDSTVLIYGESGTGKELVARLIHDASDRRAGPYVAVNCAAFQESLLESELFGHEKGAFTGADRRHLGQFERAHRGTILLDEIGEMSPACQAKLLRVLEGHPFTRLGGTELLHVDVRIIAATHRDLNELVRRGKFREDLLFRLRVIEVEIPPLRNRGEDVLLLAGYFLEQFRRQIGRGPTRLSAEAMRRITEYAWPGNVRELKNAIERACVLGSGEEVTAADLGLPLPERSETDRPQARSLADVEKEHILRVLEEVGGNKTKACQILGIGRGTLYAKLKHISRRPR